MYCDKNRGVGKVYLSQFLAVYAKPDPVDY